MIRASVMAHGCDLVVQGSTRFTQDGNRVDSLGSPFTEIEIRIGIGIGME